jgi:indole-3-glycerol phosphate synthase
MSFLGDILARKREEVTLRRAARPDEELEAALADLPPPLDFAGVLAARGGATRIIAEVKRKSPSAGPLAPALDAPGQARRYASAGAAAVSVLTDGPFFGGALEDLAAVRAAVGLPLLRKDFILDRYQLLEARLSGADAVLLIVAALETELARLLEAARQLGLGVLVEVHDERELEVALGVGARVVGVNNRDLRTFEVDLAVSERLLPRIPDPVKAVAESGLKTAADARRLREAGASNLLVGEALVRAPDPARLIHEMAG